jgi:hypothetical protein
VVEKVGATARSRTLERGCRPAPADPRAAAGTVVAEVIIWARRQTEACRISAHRDARLDRLPISESTEPELWFQLDRRHEAAWEWTCSVRADGKVVIPFQRYRQRFASEDARAQLWGRLNGVPGIGLERNLGGWPTFKIARLTDPETLRRFVQVLDFVVDESLGAGV